MRLRTWGLSRPLSLLARLSLLVLWGGADFLFATQKFSIVATAGTQTYVYNSQLVEVINYRSDLRQFTLHNQINTRGQAGISRILEKTLPPVWTISPSGSTLFGVDPETQNIVNISLSDFQKTPIILKPTNLKLFHVLTPTRWLTAIPNPTKYISIASYDLNTHTSHPLYETSSQISEAFYDPISAQLATFEFEEKSQYTDILNQIYNLKRIGLLSIINIKNKKAERFSGAYPTYNSFLREILYFDEGQLMAYSFESKRKYTMPLKFSPIYSTSGAWVSAPKLVRLPSGVFIVWLKKDDGTYQLIEYSKEGQASRILLSNQSGPVNIQLLSPLPTKFLQGDF
ncbi:MAG: hypothetical protein ACRCVN_03420 [Spirochaetia bacterium]